MRATLDIPKKLLAELKAAVPSQSRAEAVRTAVAEFVRQRKREKLRQLRGQMQIEDTSREMEATELADARHHH